MSARPTTVFIRQANAEAKTKLVMGFVVSLLIFPVFADAGPSAQIQRLYYDDGSIKGELQVRQGKLEGETRWYYESGAIGAVLSYRKNRLHGEAATFYENGLKKKITRWADNRPHGTSIYYNSDGSVSAVEVYDKGMLTKRWQYDSAGGVELCEEALQEDPPDTL